MAEINLYTETESEDGVEDEPTEELLSFKPTNLPPLVLETKSEPTDEFKQSRYYWSDRFGPGERYEYVLKEVKVRRLSTRETKPPSYLEKDYIGFERPCKSPHDFMTWRAEMHVKTRKRVLDLRLDHAIALLSASVDAERKRARLP